MTLRIFRMSASDAAAIHAAELQSKNGPFRMCCQAVRLYGLGYTVTDIQTITGCSRTRLLEWCAAYRNDGLAALQDRRRGGNRSRLTAAHRSDLQQRIHTTPRSVFGSDTATANGLVWTVPDLRRVVQQWYGVTYASLTSYRTLFARCGFSYQRPAMVYKSRNAQAVLDWEATIEKN